MRIITAIGNPKLNEELRKDNFYEVIGVDIQYQDGIFEILEKNINIDYLILNLDLIGNLNKYELIEKIKEKNANLKIIIILEKENKKLINYLFLKNIKNIVLKNEINLKRINNILKNKKEIKKLIIKNKKTINKKLNKKSIKNKYNKNSEKINLNKLKEQIKKINIKFINKKIIVKNDLLKNKKIISIIGDKKSGKTIFTLLISKIINKKILIISFIKNKEINIILGIKNNEKEECIKINNKIKLIKCNPESITRKDLQKEFKEYDYIFIDTSQLEKNNLEKITKITDNYFLILEPNLIGINNSKKIIEEILNKNNKNKIKIIINKNNYFSVNEKIIKYIFNNFKLIGKINQNNKYNFLINKNLKIIDLKIKKEYLKIIKEVESL